MQRRVTLRQSLAGIWLGVLATVVSAASASASFNVNPARHTVTTTTLTGRPVTKVNVENDNGDIILRPGRRGTVLRTEAWNFVRPSYTQSLRSGTLMIRASCPKNVPHNRCSVRLVITVPRGVDIDAATTNGSVRASGFDGRTTAAATTNGDVDVSLDAQPVSLSVEATNGDVSAAAIGKVQAPHSSVSAKSTNGNVDVSLMHAPTTLALATINGNVRGTVPAGSYRLTTRTLFGRVSVNGLRNDPAAANALSATTISGSITLSGA